MNRRRSARTIGKANDPLNPKQVLAVFARQTAKCDGELKPCHWLTQHNDKRCNAMGVHGCCEESLPSRQDRCMVGTK